MKTRTKALGLLLLLVATTCLVLRDSRPSEPNYEGKPLSFWIEQYRLEVDSSEPGPATDAMRAIGTNALPFLRNWSSYNPPRWQHQFGGQFLPRHVFGIDIVLGSQARLERADQAILALSAFRATPDMVIPELTELLKTRPAAIGALAHLGSPGFPPLLTAWSNSTDRNERWQIEYAVLQNLTPNDRNTNLVPLLLSIRNKASQSLWISASNALSQIAPDLPTNSSAR